MTDITRHMELVDNGPTVRLYTYDDWAALGLSTQGVILSIHLNAAEVRKLAEFFAESAAKLEALTYSEAA